MYELFVIVFFIIILLNINIGSKQYPILLKPIPESDVKDIPKILFQTYHTKSRIPEYVKENSKKYARNYEIHIIDDEEGLEFLQFYYTAEVIQCFNRLKGAHKADLLRYCLLYVYGGVYADIKTVFIENLDEIINHDKKAKRHQLYTVMSIFKQIGGVYQGFIATTPQNPIFLNLISTILNTSNLRLKFDYLVFTRDMYEKINRIRDQDIILFQEVCTYAEPEKADRYGLYCKIVDDNNVHIIDTRDPKYPY